MAKAKNPGKNTNNSKKCWVRVNNQGSTYTICGVPSKGPKKPPAVITKPITSEEFTEIHGPYTELTDSRKAEYHALAMRRKRWEERQASIQGQGFIEDFRDAKRDERKKNAEEREKNADARAKVRAEKKEKEKDKKAEKGGKKTSKFVAPKVLTNNKTLVNINKALSNAEDSSADTRNNFIIGMNVALRNDINKMSAKDFLKFKQSGGDNVVISIIKKQTKKDMSDFIKANMDKRNKEVQKKLKEKK
tara:strand:- start:5190 stop:5930 length:741 start_codon:yes stop_codon:yes gene_type:complete